ncbi:MAG: hypothetical protein PHX68_03785 [Alphaproteobacteria bacterium]|nr:hypothetical protein [Alphaproteobacteria bacterium]
MKKFCCMALAVFLPAGVWAQNAAPAPVPAAAPPAPSAPTQPNLGREATPVNTLIITPPLLPEISIDISDPSVMTPPAPVAPEAPAAQPAAPAAPAVPAEQAPQQPPQPAVPPQLPPTPAPALPHADASPKVVQPPPIKQTPLSEVLNKKSKDGLAVKTPKSPMKFAQQGFARIMKRQAQLAHDRAKALYQAAGKDGAVQAFESLKKKDALKVAGIGFGLTPEDVDETLTENGYALKEVEYGIPSQRRMFYDQQCRDRPVYGPAQIRKCIEDSAKAEDMYYISSLTFRKPRTNEHIQVLFTSWFQNNVSYKVYYESRGDNSLTFTEANLARKLRRKEAFFKMLSDVYGEPDDKDFNIWGDTRVAYMRAYMTGANYNAYIEMEDKTLGDTDRYEDMKDGEGLVYKHPFTFAPTGDDT